MSNKLTADRTPQGWSGSAEAYDRIIFPFTSQYAEDALRFAGVKAGERVLDVAAGTGALSLAAARLGAEVMATDFAPAMMERLRRHLKQEGLTNVKTEVMDGQDLALPADTFDAAFSVFGLIFFPDRARGFRELRRVVRPGGRVTVTTWTQLETIDVMGKALQQALPDLPPAEEPPAVYSLRDPQQIEREMTEAGLRNVHVHRVTHTWVSASPEAFWAETPPTSPVFQALVDRIGKERMGLVGEVLVAHLRERFGKGPVQLEGVALVAVAEK